jgi:hypothetical protein
MPHARRKNIAFRGRFKQHSFVLQKYHVTFLQQEGVGRFSRAFDPTTGGPSRVLNPAGFEIYFLALSFAAEQRSTPIFEY